MRSEAEVFREHQTTVPAIVSADTYRADKRDGIHPPLQANRRSIERDVKTYPRRNPAPGIVTGQMTLPEILVENVDDDQTRSPSGWRNSNP